MVICSLRILYLYLPAIEHSVEHIPSEKLHESRDGPTTPAPSGSFTQALGEEFAVPSVSLSFPLQSALHCHFPFDMLDPSVHP